MSRRLQKFAFENQWPIFQFPVCVIRLSASSQQLVHEWPNNPNQQFVLITLRHRYRGHRKTIGFLIYLVLILGQLERSLEP
jgi:hypothetical protein